MGLTVRETAKGCDVLQAGFLWLRIGVPTLTVTKKKLSENWKQKRNRNNKQKSAQTCQHPDNSGINIEGEGVLCMIQMFKGMGHGPCNVTERGLWAAV